jgi:predicted NUDIX family phosphoesterase
MEHVLVVPTEVFHRLGHFQGFSPDVEKYRDTLFAPENTRYLPRSAAEEDPSFKQLIPYVIFRHRDASGVDHVFQYTRGKGQGENRLHSKRSVGIGGHISSEDGVQRGSHPYEDGMRRELAEEVIVDSRCRERCVGLINDDLTEVGRVHLGIVHLFDIDQPLVAPREADIIDSGFRPVADLLSDLSRFESWSEICLRALFQN